MDWYHVILYYLYAVNIAAFAMMGIDKYRARKDLWRIPEATLLTAAGLGGAIGAIGGMYLFRHKTRKKKFYLGLPAILAAQLILAAVVLAVCAHL